MAQRTLFPAFEIWSLIPGEDKNVSAQCHSIRFLQSANQKHNRCRFRNPSPHAVLPNKYENMITKIFPKLYEKFGRLFVHSLNHFRKLKKKLNHIW